MAVRIDTPQIDAAAAAPSGRAVQIGRFTLYPERHVLQRDGEPVRIGSRALSLLIALVEKRG